MNPKTNYMPPDQLEEVIKAIPLLNLRRYNERDVEALFRIAYWCGLRITKACQLRKEDFDLVNKEIFLGAYKGKKNYYQVIPDPFMPWLVEYLQGKQDGPLIDSNRNTVDYWIRKLGRELGIKAWTTPQSETGEKTKCHIFRKSIGKDMMLGTHKDKTNIFVISKFLGHSSPRMTEKYLKMDSEAAREYWES